MAGIRRYPDEAELNDLVCPREPEPPEPKWVEDWEAKMEQEKRDLEARKEAREEKSRQFRITEKAVTGGMPEEEY